MIPNEIVIPSEINEINLTAESGAPFYTNSEAYGFVVFDDCYNETDQDISVYDFNFVAKAGGCVKLELSTLTGELVKGSGLDNNKLWFEVPVMPLPRGVYSYLINIVGSNSVIKGILTVI